MGDGERAPRRGFSFHPAGGVKHCRVGKGALLRAVPTVPGRACEARRRRWARRARLCLCRRRQFVRARLCPPYGGSKIAAFRASSRSGETTGAVRGATPVRSAVFARLGQGAPYTVGVEVLGVDRRTGLLPPGLVQPAGIDAVKAQLVDELQDDGLGCGVIARDGQGDAAGAKAAAGSLVRAWLASLRGSFS
jgi:hypothetical protein